MALVDTETGECGERRPAHREEAEQFYREVKARSLSVRWGWNRAGTDAGLSVCCGICSLSCGSGTLAMMMGLAVSEF